MIHYLRSILEASSPGPWSIDEYQRIVVPSGKPPSDELLKANLELTVAARNVLPLLLGLWEAVDKLHHTTEFLEDGDYADGESFDAIEDVEDILVKLSAIESPTA